MEDKIYWALRDEILYNYEQENSLIQFVYTAVIAALGLAITMQISWLAFVVSIAIVPMSLRIADIRYSTAYIATYLKTYLENPDNKFSWENMHHSFSEKHSGKTLKDFIYNACRMDFCILVVICSIVFWSIHGIDLIGENLAFTILVVTLQVFIIFFEGFIGIKFANLRKLKNDLIPKWEKIGKEDQNDKL